VLKTLEKITSLFESIKIPESPKYAKQRFCSTRLNNYAKDFLNKIP
jgi:hypothetical protein